ncbi:MAG: MotA/TolQ/ExbB proton channel family protein [Gammaproteobacteria bacterium]|nr:MotA/TolQ/ExbB proton channel family protein [Gammaproteobacteria bacterium]
MVPARGPHHLFLAWLIPAGLSVFLLFVSWTEGGLALMYSTDRSRICWVITLIFAVICAHAARRFFLVSRELDSAVAVREILLREAPANVRVHDGRLYLGNASHLPDCLVSEYLHDHLLLGGRENSGAEHSGSSAELAQVFQQRLKHPHEIGWFLSDVMIKLGLLGTIVGFVLMLGSVLDVTEFDARTMQAVLKKMSTGMGTALYTTFAGLVCSILTNAQYHALDQASDRIMEIARHLAQIRILPAARRIKV